MVHTRGFALAAGLLLLQTLPHAFAHGDDTSAGEAMNMGSPNMAHLLNDVPTMNSSMNLTIIYPESYFSRHELSGLILAHITLMIVAWFFILPIGIMLSIARYPFALAVQLSFLCVHSTGLLLGTIYNGKTPNLYPNNSHNPVGWITTWVVVGQCVIGLVKLAVSVAKTANASAQEQAAFLPVSAQALADQEVDCSPSSDADEHSRDTGHFTASPESSRSNSITPLEDNYAEEQQKLREYRNAHSHADYSEKGGLLDSAKIQDLASRITARVSKRTMKVLDAMHNVVDRAILLLGFIAIVSGTVVYGGAFHGHMIFSGLAHTIKGGIFFWYGLLTLGRWMGCFAQYGWAWNMRPPIGVVSSRQVRVPSAEFTESFVIFFYGASNVFLEHLGKWGGEWTAQDLEHISITIMFFGGGLCGMLVESSHVRDLLNSVMLISPAAHASHATMERLSPPKTYPFSLNPFPGLIILLLGLLMSAHDQSSMVATMVHKQWGYLFVGFALARALTYFLTYISPPTSYLPSRPPTELITSFCLISGGIIFMASNGDAVGAMEIRQIHAMIPFTVTMGFTAIVMAWTIIVLTVKGWAVRKQVLNFSTAGTE